jgi:hypothetical protein
VKAAFAGAVQDEIERRMRDLPVMVEREIARRRGRVD